MEIPAELQGYEHLPVPIMVGEGGALLYGNRALYRALGLSRETASESLETLIAQAVDPKEQSAMRDVLRSLAQELTPMELWVTLRPHNNPTQRRLYRLWRVIGPRLNQWTCVLQETTPEESARDITQTLVSSTDRLLNSKSEEEILEVAASALFSLGYFSACLALEDHSLRIVSIYGDPEALDAAEKAAHITLRGYRFSLSGLPADQYQTLFHERRVDFTPDQYSQHLAPAYPPEVVAELKRRYPQMKGLRAPLFRGRRPYGILSASSPDLRPAATATVALFAQVVSSALDNAHQHQVAQERLEQLHTLQRELVERERMAALGEAAAVMAHEVRNPLTSILNCVTLLRLDNPATRGEILGMLEEESNRLEALVRQLVEYTRPMALQPRNFSLRSLVRQSMEGFEERQEGRHPRFVIQVDGDDSVRADEGLVELALEHLLRNSVQSAPQDSLITVHITGCVDRVHLSVEDEGPGIPAEHRPRIFEPFFTTRAKGSGLGLPLAKRIIDLHGGQVSVGDNDRGGARISLELPRVPARDERTEPGAHNHAVPTPE